MICFDCTTEWEPKRPTPSNDGQYRCKRCNLKRRQKKYTQDSDVYAAYQKKYAVDHADEKTQYALEWGRNNRDKQHVHHKKYRQSEKGKIVGRRKSKKHYWTAPGYYRMRARAIYAGKEMKIIRELFERQQECQLCGVTEEIQKLTVDHMHPSSKGGKTKRENIQVLCMPCNSFKKDRIFLAENQGILLNG